MKKKRFLSDEDAIAIVLNREENFDRLVVSEFQEGEKLLSGRFDQRSARNFKCGNVCVGFEFIFSQGVQYVASEEVDLALEGEEKLDQFERRVYSVLDHHVLAAPLDSMFNFFVDVSVFRIVMDTFQFNRHVQPL
jgi:hypothetical protein